MWWTAGASLRGISAIDSTSSVMRKAVGPMRVHTHLSHNGPPADTPSVWTKTNAARQWQKLCCAIYDKDISIRISVRVLICSYTFHLLFAHDESRAGRDAVGTVLDGARERLARLHQGAGHLRLQEVFLEMTGSG